MSSFIYDRQLTNRLSRVQTELAFLQMQLAGSSEDRARHCETFLEFLDQTTRGRTAKRVTAHEPA